MKRRTVVFTAPRRVELIEEPLPVPAAGEVLVETTCSAVSAGTEMLVYRGTFPRGLETDPNIQCLRGDFQYPLAYGYAAAGVVRETGSGVDNSWRDQPVFAFQTHTSHFITTPQSLHPIPGSIAPETACFLPNMETAVNLIQDGAPIIGERVLVLGQGVVGLLVASLLKQFPLDCLVTADSFPLRRRASLVLGVTDSLDPGETNYRAHLLEYAPGGFDLVYELSSNPVTLNDAIASARFSGRIVIGSWYGEEQAPLNLGGSFHRSRISLISSQVSTIAPGLSARWDKSRRFTVAWGALERVQPSRWITHRYPLEEAAQAYQLLEGNPGEAIQVHFEHHP